MSRPVILSVLAVVGLAVGGLIVASQGGSEVTLLNASYDPTRELWAELNTSFIPHYAKLPKGGEIEIDQSHGGSSAQARAINEGLEADVVTLALWADVDAIRKAGLINGGKPGWEDRLPNRSLPYTSTIVFVVRKGNPEKIFDWPDLVRDAQDGTPIQVITPHPQTSGNGKLSFLAAWGSVLRAGGTEEEALALVTKIYRNHAKTLETGARQSTITFTKKKQGHVHLTWENEAFLEVKESGGELEIVYPKTSILAEPYVSIVDKNVDRKGTRAAAEAYLKYLYTDEAQQIIAKNYYRPSNEKILKKFSEKLQPIELFPVTLIAKDWDDANQKFFVTGAIFDKILAKSGG